MIKYLFFDLDNTLYSSRYGLEDNVRSRIGRFCGPMLGLGEEEFWTERMKFREQYGTTLEWLVKEKNFTEVDKYLASAHPADEADNLPADPELRSFLESLPLPKAVLTNAPREHAVRILDKLGVGDLFTHIFEIREAGFVGKPHREFFVRALDVLGIQAEEALFVDDIPQYVAGFLALGGRGLLLDENDLHARYPHQKIRELKELVRYL